MNSHITTKRWKRIDIMVKLGEHQRKAVNQLQNGNILCGGVGTGKSRTSLAYYICKVCEGRIDKKVTISKKVDLYIITTARKRDTKEWEAEMLPFLLGTDICPIGVKVVVDSWNNIQKYVDVEGAFFIFDEQRVVGKGAWAKSFIKLSKKNQWILLTATPGDDWEDYIPVFIANGFYKNRTEFMRQHAVYNKFITKYPKVEGWSYERQLIRYRDSITVYMKYKKDTKPHTNYILAEYDRHTFKHVWKDRWNVFEDKPVENVSELCYTLRKVVNKDISRIDILKQVLEKRTKVIVFYNFDYELDILRQFAVDNKITYAEWNGHKHEPLPITKEWLYFVQYTAGAEGWNCIETDTIVFYSLSYSYKATIQAAGRIDRLNTPFTDLYYYYIYSHAPIDLAIRRCLEKKKNFNEKIFVEKSTR